MSAQRSKRWPVHVVAASSSGPSEGVLLAVNGVANNEIARQCDATPNAVRRWRSKFAAEAVAGIGRIRPGRGRKPELAPELIEAIVHDSLHTTPADATHWSTRSVAEHAGVGKDTVAPHLAARNIRPWRVETFKLSNDSNFETKLVDVVGLYLDPPERAVCSASTRSPNARPWSAASRSCRSLRAALVVGYTCYSLSSAVTATSCTSGSSR